MFFIGLNLTCLSSESYLPFINVIHLAYRENVFCLQVTGGGGYTKENVARCWTVETGVLLDSELPNGRASDFYFIKYTLFLPLSFNFFFNGTEKLH